MIEVLSDDFVVSDVDLFTAEVASVEGSPGTVVCGSVSFGFVGFVVSASSFDAGGAGATVRSPTVPFA